MFTNRKMSQTQDMTRAANGQSTLDKRIEKMHGRGQSNALRETGNKTIDLSTYRGNLYKQTLSPEWSKTQLREAQRKYEKIAEDARRSV
jgi:hypothetical protein